MIYRHGLDSDLFRTPKLIKSPYTINQNCPLQLIDYILLMPLRLITQSNRNLFGYRYTTGFLILAFLW